MKPALPSLMVVTDGRLEPDVVRRAGLAAIGGGARAIQVRRHGRPVREILELCEVFRPALEEVDGVLLVNDRVDVVAAGYAHGVHLGFRSLSIRDARRVVGEHRLVGSSTHSRAELEAALAAGADYATLSPICPTRSHDDVTALGYRRAREWTAEVSLPVFWLGGVEARDWEHAVGAQGLAAISPFRDPASATASVREFLDAEKAVRAMR
ncbi:MAG: thiamine phosphate synthase [Planctomycetota bacterium]